MRYAVIRRVSRSASKLPIAYARLPRKTDPLTTRERPEAGSWGRVSSRVQSLFAGYTVPVASGKGCRIFRGFFHGRGVRHCNHTMSCRILQVRGAAPNAPVLTRRQTPLRGLPRLRSPRQSPSGCAPRGFFCSRGELVKANATLMVDSTGVGGGTTGIATVTASVSVSANLPRWSARR